jgi:hypothetical protein
MDEIEVPSTLTINAWTGEKTPKARLSKKTATQWGVRRQVEPVKQFLAAPPLLDLRNWQDPDVGWGVVLPENEAIAVAERAVGADAPEPIRELLAARNQAPVFRYRADLLNEYLRRYYLDGKVQDVQISSAIKRGTEVGCLPFYLLIVGSPKTIPWSLQYALNQPCFVGRLDLEEAGLKNYVKALLSNWPDAGCRADQPVVWAVDHGTHDITENMRRIIAEPVAARLKSDDQIGDKVKLLTAKQATVNALTAALMANQPALIVSTSHGMTGPLDNLAAMQQQLGVLVDTENRLLQLDKLLAQWQPDGAIWYAHACCSAGSDSKNSYKGLITASSQVARVLDTVALLGAQVAPLPKALLGAKKPLRAFLGHVEPTFDWTIRDPNTGQKLTETLQAALYNHLYQKVPESIGLAFQECYNHVGELFAQWSQALDVINDSASTPAEREAARKGALRTQLTALDRQSLVILGDPTVALPPL